MLAEHQHNIWIKRGETDLPNDMPLGGYARPASLPRRPERPLQGLKRAPRREPLTKRGVESNLLSSPMLAVELPQPRDPATIEASPARPRPGGTRDGSPLANCSSCDFHRARSALGSCVFYTFSTRQESVTPGGIIE